MISKEINGALAAAMKASGGEWYGPVYTVLALAQRSEAAGVDRLLEMLDSPSSEVRLAVLDGVGGVDNPHGPGFHKRGLGVVADERLIPKLLQFRGMESGKGAKQRAVIAAVAIRAAVAANKAK